MINVTEVGTVGTTLVLMADEVGPEEHSMFIPVEAVGSRMALLDLDDPREALAALVREHYILMHDDIESPQTLEAALAQHEEYADVAVSGCEDKIEQLLIEFAPQIVAARDARIETDK